MEIRVFVKFTRLHGSDVVVAVVVVVAAAVAVVVVVIKNENTMKVECPNKISPLLHPCFYNINTFNASFKSQFNFTHYLDSL